MQVLKYFHSKLNILIAIFMTLTVSGTAHAVSLKSLAQKSALLLAVADSDELQKKCKISASDVSMNSQALKVEVDAKIQSLTEKDFVILNARTTTCQNDCTCSIYALAFETHNKENKAMKESAEKLTQADRLKCAKQFNNVCQLVKN